MPDSSPMGNFDSGRLREIAWLEIFPWLRLVGTLRIALRVRTLLLATLGLVLTLWGWWLLAKAFGGSDDVAPLVSAYTSCVWTGDPAGVSGIFIPSDVAPGPHLAHFPALPFRDAWWKLSAPVRQMFSSGVTYVSFAFLLVCMLWGIAVWSLFGGAIARTAALAIGREETLPMREALRFAGGKWLSSCGAPLLPLLAVLFVGLPMIVAGLLLRTDVGAAALGVAWPLMLVGGLLITVMLLGLFFGWPLMFAAVNTENSDSFDAISRAYSYVNQRPLQYLWYAIVATGLSWLGALLADNFADAVIRLTAWMASWGSGNGRMFELTLAPGSELFAAKAIWFWNGALRLVALSFVFSHFWVASTAIYLLLRRDTDGAELDEMYVDHGEESFGLPPVETDANGVAVIAEEVPTGASNPSDAAKPQA